VGFLVVLVAFGFADGEGQRQGQAAEEVLEVGGVLPGGIEADVEVRLRVLLVELFQALPQSLIAGVVFEDGEGLGSRLAVGTEEGDAMAVTGGVDADADAVERGGGGRHGDSPRSQKHTALFRSRAGGVSRGGGVSVLRGALAWESL
jgi:hypothetical protein